jgi:aminoglycoside phosphotransferase (APT) family kinase protein
MKDVGQTTSDIRNPLHKLLLIKYLSNNAPNLSVTSDNEISIKQFSLGQSNPTYLITILATNKSFVLRKSPDGTLLDSTAHNIPREYAILQALEGKVPVPQVFHLCTDKQVIGGSFYAMEFIEGRIFSDSFLSSVKSQGERKGIYHQAITTLAQLHSLDISFLPSKKSRGGGFYARQIRVCFSAPYLVDTFKDQRAPVQDRQSWSYSSHI